MNYLKFGSSKNFLVFLHGWGADKNSFLWLKDYFCDYSLIFLDFAGFGNSTEPLVPYSVYDYTLELKNLLDQFDIERLILVGHSFGGRVAIKFSYLFQNDYKFYNVVLVDSAGIKPRRSIVYHYKVFRYKWLKKRVILCEKYSKKIAKCGSKDYKNLSKVMKQTLINVVNEDLSYDSKQINCKTLIVWGDKDKDTKLYMAKKLKRYIKNSELKVIKSAGHFCFLDYPIEFVIILDTFIKNL